MPKTPKRGRVPFNDQDVETILRVASESREGPRDRLIVMLALWCGLRLNEIREPRWPEDVNLREGHFDVREETTKTLSGARAVPIDPFLVSHIDRYIQDERSQSLFLNQHGRPLTYHGFARVQSRLTIASRVRE